VDCFRRCFRQLQAGRFLKQLRATLEVDGDLLDRYGSGMSNGKGGGHSPKNLPLLLAGGRKRGLRHGSHLKFEIDSPPLSNVLLTMLQGMGVQQKGFIDSSGVIRELIV
jgi:hypothetical protein